MSAGSWLSSYPCVDRRRTVCQRWIGARRAGTAREIVVGVYEVEHPCTVLAGAWMGQRQAQVYRRQRQYRDQQQRRNAERDHRPVPVIAKMDASGSAPPGQTGLYLLSGMQDSTIAKMNAWIVEITFLAAT